MLLGVAAIVMAAPGLAQAYEVRISLSGAGTVTETTSANLVGSGCTTSANAPTGSVTKVCLAGTSSGAYGYLWDVDYVATPKSGYSFVRWESDGTTRAGVICDRSDPAATTTTYTGTVCKFRTPSDLQTRAVFEDVTDPQMASLSGPNGPVNGATAFTFSAAADPTVTGFECRVANVHDWAACSSGRTEDPATSGTYTFEVRAVDSSSNKSAPSTWSWTVDKIRPQTTLDSDTGPAEDSAVSSNAASFQFSTNESGSFRCTLDGTELTPCGSPKSLTGLGDGPHAFAVWAVDTAGNPDDTPAERHWTVDTVAPETTIDKGPRAKTSKRTAKFLFSSPEAGATFACSLDGGAFKECASPREYKVKPGKHTLQVRAQDKAKNVDALPAEWSWKVLR